MTGYKVYLVLFILCSSYGANAQGLIEATESIARQMASTIASAGYESVAVVDPLSPTDEASAFGRFLAEELSGAMVNLGQLRVIDRLSLQRILDEQRLSVSGLVNDADAVQRIGDLAGVEVLVLGTYFVLGNAVRLSLKGLNVQTAESVAAVNASLVLDDNVRTLLALEGRPIATDEIADGNGLPEVSPSHSDNVTFDQRTGDYYVYDLCDTPSWIEVQPTAQYSTVAFTLSPNSAMNAKVRIYVGSRLGFEATHTVDNRDMGKSSDTRIAAQVGPNPTSNVVRIEIEKYREVSFYDWNCSGTFAIRGMEIQ